MNKFFASAAVVSVLAAAPAAFALETSAIPQTGTFTKAPVGSTVNIESTGKFGTRYQNYFRVAENGELEFVFQDTVN